MCVALCAACGSASAIEHAQRDHAQDSKAEKKRQRVSQSSRFLRYLRFNLVPDILTNWCHCVKAVENARERIEVRSAELEESMRVREIENRKIAEEERMEREREERKASKKALKEQQR